MALTASVSDFNGGVTGVLASYPFDIWDGEAKTVVYKIGYGEGNPYWMGAYNWAPEYFATLQNELYSFRNGILYQHNQSNYNQFYGTQFKSRVMCVANSNPNIVKLYNGVSIEANMVPTWTYLYGTDPYQQTTDIMDYEYSNVEGMWYAIVKRNKLLPTQSGYTINNIVTGERMRSYTLFLLAEFTVGAIPLELRFININFDISRGHSTT
jgi:hypothetical protein